MKHEGFQSAAPSIESETNSTAEQHESKRGKEELFRTLGETALSYVTKGQNLEHVEKNAQFITRESVHNYRDNRSEKNLDALRRYNVAPYLTHAYENLIKENPELAMVDLDFTPNDYANASFSALGENKYQIRPRIAYNFLNPNIYNDSKHELQSEFRGLDIVYAEIALRTGARPSDVMSNERLAQIFIMCHEFGHAKDFINNYLSPAYRELRKQGQTEHLGVDCVKNAYTESRKDRNEDLTQLLFGSLESDTAGEIGSIMYSRLVNLGANPRDKQEMDLLRNKSYRKTRSENFADTFATDYIMSHHDEFFYDPDSGEEPNGRIPAYYDRVLRVPGELLPVLDFAPGSHVSCRYKDESGKTGSFDSCYLTSRLRVGGEFGISTSGDPTDKDGLHMFDGSISQILIKPQRDGNNIFCAKLDNDSMITFQLNKEDPEAPEIEVDGSEIEKRYRLGVGSELVLLKVNQNQDSKVDAGDLLHGKLKYSMRTGENIVLGDSYTTSVQRYYRRWKQYFAETRTSVYEVLPIRKKH